MNEHITLADCVRAALEEGVALDSRRMKAIRVAAAREAKIRRSRRRIAGWGSAGLAAASVAAALALSSMLPASRTPTDANVDNAIGLLCEIEGVDVDSLGASDAGELLLAWQDAPFGDLL